MSHSEVGVDGRFAGRTPPALAASLAPAVGPAPVASAWGSFTNESTQDAASISTVRRRETVTGSSLVDVRRGALPSTTPRTATRARQRWISAGPRPPARATGCDAELTQLGGLSHRLAVTVTVGRMEQVAQERVGDPDVIGDLGDRSS